MRKISINSEEFFNNSHFHKSFCLHLFAENRQIKKEKCEMDKIVLLDLAIDFYFP